MIRSTCIDAVKIYFSYGGDGERKLMFFLTATNTFTLTCALMQAFSVFMGRVTHNETVALAKTL